MTAVTLTNKIYRIPIYAVNFNFKQNEEQQKEMLLRFVIVLLAVVSVALIAMAQPAIKTTWRQVNEVLGAPYLSERVEPRLAAFSDGRYVVVYVIQTSNSIYWVVGKIYNRDGSIYKSEFYLSDTSSVTDFLIAPNVIVFEDDTFLVAWKVNNANPRQIKARRFDSSGSPLGASFNAYDSNIVPASDHSIELRWTRLNGFAVTYTAINGGSCTGTAGVGIVQFDGNNNKIFSVCYDGGELSAPRANLAYDTASTNVFFALETDSGGMNVGGAGSDALNRVSQKFSFSTSDQMTLLEPAVVINAPNAMSVFAVASSSIYAFSFIPPLPSPGGFKENLFKQRTTTIAYSSPRTVRINSTATLVAYRSANINGEGYIGYQLANYTASNGQLTVTPVGDEYSLAIDIVGLHMVALPGTSDIVMVGKVTAPSSLTVMRQVLTFCGNGELDMAEECDGSANCTDNCRCEDGFYGFNGVCTYPNVEPSLDCVEVRETNYVLYFSFHNKDLVAHNIEYGLINNFGPKNLATDRPTIYPRGQSLTFPASPYSTAVPFSISKVTWQFGSYNLTVDITDSSLMCSNSSSFALNVASQTSSSNAAKIVQNFATKYGVDVSRLSYSETIITDTVPYRFLIRITIGKATGSQPTAAQVLGSLLIDYRNTSTRAQVENDLTQGTTVVIKQVTPDPAGNQVRGTRSDPTTNSGDPDPETPSNDNPTTPISTNPNTPSIFNPNALGPSKPPSSSITSSASLVTILFSKSLIVLACSLLV